MQDTFKDIITIIQIPELRLAFGLAAGSVVGTFNALREYGLVSIGLTSGVLTPERVSEVTDMRMRRMGLHILIGLFILAVAQEPLSAGFVLSKSAVEMGGEYILQRNADDIAGRGL